MGVCGCSRYACGNVMCKVLTVFGDYICDECQLEFKIYMKEKGLEKAKREIYDDELENFMNTIPGSYNEISVDDYFNNDSSE